MFLRVLVSDDGQFTLRVILNVQQRSMYHVRELVKVNIHTYKHTLQVRPSMHINAEGGYESACISRPQQLLDGDLTGLHHVT